MKFYSFFSLLLFSITTAFSQPVWNKVTSNTNNNLNSISFGSEQVGYIGGDDFLILKTLDGGMTWNPIQHMGIDSFSNPPIKDIVHIEFVSETDGFLIVNDSRSIVYYSGYTYKTLDGGVTWQLEGSHICSPYKTFHFNPNKGFAIGASCFGGKTIMKKENGIYSPNVNYLSWNIEYLKAIDFVDTLQGIAAGDSTQIYRTFNGGMSWDTIDINHTSAIPVTITDLMYLNDSTVLMASNVPDIIYSISNDNGLSWNHVSTTSFLDPQIKAIALSAKDSIISIGINFNDSLGFISYYNKSNGWDYNRVTNEALNEIDMQNDSIAYVVGDKGAIYTNSGSLTPVHNIADAPVVHMYPNPTSKWLNIESEHMEFIEIYHSDGKLIKQIHPTNHQEVQLDNSELKNGNYFLKIHFTDGNSISKQIVIL